MTQHKEKILKLYSEGKSYSEIQKILGCSKGTISYHLGVGQKEKTSIRRKDKRNSIRKYIQEYKQSKPCMDCKENYPYWIMDFDHLENKSFGISSFSTKSMSLDIIKNEIEKCDLVCANCHRNRTYLRLFKNGSDSLDLSSYY